MVASKSVQVLVCVVILSVNMSPAMSAPDTSAVSRAWSQFKRDFNKSYASPGEEAHRRELFTAELLRIEAHNANASSSYKLGLNHMSDWTESEFKQLLTLDKAPLQDLQAHQSSKLHPIVLAILQSRAFIPMRVDWRQDGKRVSRVKHQGRCGSCWAFAVTGLLEGQQVVRNFTDRLVPLSEQLLLDCIALDGCKGYQPDHALDHVAMFGGIMSEDDYGYQAIDNGVCTKDEKKFVMKTSGAVLLPAGDEELIAKTVARYGPVVVGLASASWRSYLSGIWPASACEGNIDHAVLVVGYDTDNYDNKYWIVKNSWGAGHGEGGYIKIERGKNACQIASQPLIASF